MKKNLKKAEQTVGTGGSKRIAITMGLLLTLANGAGVLADVRLPAIISDNMVLQQGMAAPLWGKADPGEKITVSVAGQSVTAETDDQGRWKVKLTPLKASGTPVTVTVRGKNTLTITNVLVGEVWLGSGQSNMEWPALHSGKDILDAARFPNLRLFKTENAVALTPQEDVPGSWVECTPETVKKFSAVLYAAGRELHQKLGVPVGLIQSSWGGTVIQSWSRYESITTDAEAQAAVDRRLAELDDPAWCEADFKKQTARYERLKGESKENPDDERNPRKPEKLTALFKNRPCGLYNAKIAPLAGYGIRGAVWYQGEFNAPQAGLYQRLLPLMINDWRAQWGQGAFPFIIVQLPNIGKNLHNQPVMSRAQWAALRESQRRTLALTNTALVVTIDVSDGLLHPVNKEPFGHRVALAALRLAYGQTIPFSGPLYQSMTVEGNAIRVRFDEVDGGLTAKDNAALKGFAIAGEDRKFVWAEARIDGETLVVSSPDVVRPVAVRYAWADNPVLTLYSKAGLPASPFRSDNW